MSQIDVVEPSTQLGVAATTTARRRRSQPHQHVEPAGKSRVCLDPATISCTRPRSFREHELARKRWDIGPCRRRALTAGDCPGRLPGRKPTTPRHRKPQQLQAQRRGHVTGTRWPGQRGSVRARRPTGPALASAAVDDITCAQTKPWPVVAVVQELSQRRSRP